MGTSNTTTVFTIYDSTTNQVIENAIVTFETPINSTWVRISSVNSDFSGKVAFSYTEDVPYKITFTKSGYANKEVILNPIVYATYTVRMDLTASDTDSQNANVQIVIQPQIYYNNAINNLSFTFSSPDGIFQTYGYTAYAGNNLSLMANSTGNNAIGEILNSTLNITFAPIGTNVYVNYWYYDIYNVNHTYTAVYLIQNGTYPTWTFQNMKDAKYGLALFDRVLIMLFTLLIGAGLAFYFGGLEGSALIGILIMGFFTVTGFIPFALTAISCIVLFLLMGGGNR
jgi:hypothetical protein